MGIILEKSKHCQFSGDLVVLTEEADVELFIDMEENLKEAGDYTTEISRQFKPSILKQFNKVLEKDGRSWLMTYYDTDLGWTGEQRFCLCCGAAEGREQVQDDSYYVFYNKYTCGTLQFHGKPVFILNAECVKNSKFDELRFSLMQRVSPLTL